MDRVRWGLLLFCALHEFARILAPPMTLHFSFLYTCLIGCVPLVGYQENESEERRDGSREGEGQQVFPDPVAVQILVHQERHQAKSCKWKKGLEVDTENLPINLIYWNSDFCPALSLGLFLPFQLLYFSIKLVSDERSAFVEFQYLKFINLKRTFIITKVTINKSYRICYVVKS